MAAQRFQVAGHAGPAAFGLLVEKGTILVEEVVDIWVPQPSDSAATRSVLLASTACKGF